MALSTPTTPPAPGATPPGTPPTPDKSAASPFGAMFSKKAEPVKQSASQTELSESVSMVIRRLRVIESRFENVRKKLQFVEQNMLEANKKLQTEVKTTNMELLELKSGMLELQSRIRMIVKEVQLRADKEDVDVLKKYLSYWEPIKFVTAEQVEKIVRRILEEG